MVPRPLGRIKASRAVTDDRNGVPPKNPPENNQSGYEWMPVLLQRAVLWEKTNLSAVPAEEKREKTENAEKTVDNHWRMYYDKREHMFEWRTT